jgi:hypothetical protein
MSAIEYLSGNSLIAYPFRDGRAVNSSFPIADDVFLDALFVVFQGTRITRPYISKLTVIQNTIGLEVSDIHIGAVGTISIPFFQAVSHSGNTQDSFFYYVGSGWAIKLIFGAGIENIKILGTNVNFNIEQTEFSQSVVINNVPTVTALSFESYVNGSYTPYSVHTYSAEDTALMKHGTNNDFNFSQAETMYLDVKRGNGTGLYDPCNEGIISDIYTINNVNPDNSGSFFIVPDDCYSFKLLTYNETQLYSYMPAVEAAYGDFKTPVPALGNVAAHTGHFNAIAGSMGGHGLVMQNNCKPKCPPQNLNAFAEYLNRVTDGAAELYKLVNNEYETYGVGSISDSIFTSTNFCGGTLPSGWGDGVCNGQFLKYFHEGRTINIKYSSNTTYTYTILEVLDSHRVLLDAIPPINSNPSLPFKVSDFGIKNKLDEIIISNNEKLSTKNVPSININYSTVEAYNAAQQYGTFITTVIIIYNPSPAPLHFSVTGIASGQATIIPSSIKVKTSSGVIAYGSNQGVISCKDYSTFEAIYFIPCSQNMDAPNEGAVAFHVVDSSTGLDIENSPKVVSAAAASCVSASSSVIYVTAKQGEAFSYTIENTNAVGFSFSGDIPSWLNTDSTSGTIHGSPTGTTSHSYTITVSITETGGGGLIQIITIDYIALPVILNPVDNTLFVVYPPDTTSRTYTVRAPLLPITASNSPTSYTFTGIPTGLTQTGNGLVGQIALDPSQVYPITYQITATATNEAGTSDPVNITLELTNTPITTPPAYQNTPFCYSITVGPEVLSQALATTLPSWLSFDHTINLVGAATPVCSFYGTNSSYTPTTNVVIVRQNLIGGTYRLVEFLIPYVTIPSISYPQNGSAFPVYPPDFNNQNGDNTTFTDNHPLLTVVATNNPTSFSASGLPAGLSIDSFGKVIGKITGIAGVYNVVLTATNGIGTSSSVSFTVELNSQVSIIPAYQGQGLCYKFTTLSNASSFYLTGDIPSWLSVSQTVSSSCHISANRLVSSQSQDYPITVVGVINGANLSQTYVLRYIALPIISYPADKQVININSANYNTIVYTSTAPLFQAVATNSPTSYSVDGLPSGLTIDTSGNVIGTITGGIGNYPVKITALNDAGSASINITISVSDAAIILSAFQHQPFCYKLNSFGAVTGYSYTGNIPSWLTFDWTTNAACNLNGTPTDNISTKYNFTLIGQTVNGDVSINFEIDYTVIPVITFPVDGTVFQITPPDFNARIFTTTNPLFKVIASNNPTSYFATGFNSNTLQIDKSSGAIIGVSGSTPTTNNIPITLTAKNASGTSSPVVVYIKLTANPITININADSGDICYLLDTSDNPSALTITGLPSWLTLNYPSVNGCSISGTVPLAQVNSTSYPLLLTRTYGIGNLKQSVVLNIIHKPIIVSPNSGIDSALQNSYSIYPPDFNHRIYSTSSPLLTINATNSPTSYSVDGLPSGLTLDTSGRVIGGPVNIEGEYPVIFTATNTAGTSDAAICLIEVKNSTQTVELNHESIFCNNITTKDGASNYTITGTLPSGITFNGTPGLTCNFSGIPASSNIPGNYPIDITSIYKGGSSKTTVEFNFVVPPTITTTTSTFKFLPSEYIAASPYTDNSPLIHISYTNNPTSFSASGLPAGLEITCLGNIVGSLTSASTGKYTVSVKAINSAGSSAPYTFSLDLSQITPSIIWAQPASIPYGTPLSSTQLSATAQDDTGATITGTFTYTPDLNTLLAVGNNTLTTLFTPSNTLDYITATSAVPIVVTKYTPQITWATPADITYGTQLSSIQLNSVAKDVAGNDIAGTFSYSPQGGTTPNGGNQVLNVNFYPTDTLDFNNGSGTTTIHVNRATVSANWDNPTAITYGTALGTNQLNAKAYIFGTSTTVPGTYQYSPDLGTILSAGTHTLSVTFIPIVSSNYIRTPVTATVNIVVNKANPIISWNAPAPIDYGTALSSTQLNATQSNSNPQQGTFVYTPPIGTVLTAGQHTLSVTFVPDSTGNYNSLTTTRTITINKLTPQINWATPAGISYGTQLSSSQLNATITGNIAGKLTYTPALGTVPNGGTQQLTALFTPDDLTNYITSRATVMLNVTPVTPVISWGPISAIPYGTPLSNTQLNATLTTVPPIDNIPTPPGTLSYTPGLGTILNAGVQMITVVYTPSNSANFNTVSSTNTVVVNKITPTLNWSNPLSSIFYLRQLSSTDINISANDTKGRAIAGTFTYNAVYSSGGASTPVVLASAAPPSLGTVLNAGNYTLTATFTPADVVNYVSGISISSGLTVNPAMIDVNWDPKDKAAYGSTPVSYSCAYIGPSKDEFSPFAIGTDIVDGVLTNSAHLSVLGTLNIYPLPPDPTAKPPIPPTIVNTPPKDSLGNQNYVYGGATFDPTDKVNYSEINGDSKPIPIQKYTPYIYWNNPSPVHLNTRLSDTQLNATITNCNGTDLSKSGTIVYNPPAGTNITNTTALYVTFTPTGNNVNLYDIVTKAVDVKVI